MCLNNTIDLLHLYYLNIYHFFGVLQSSKKDNHTDSNDVLLRASEVECLNISRSPVITVPQERDFFEAFFFKDELLIRIWFLEALKNKLNGVFESHLQNYLLDLYITYKVCGYY